MRAVGGHFIVGFRSISEIESLAEKGLIGGLYVTRRNLQKTTPQRLAAEIASLQERRLAAGCRCSSSPPTRGGEVSPPLAHRHAGPGDSGRCGPDGGRPGPRLRPRPGTGAGGAGDQSQLRAGRRFASH